MIDAVPPAAGGRQRVQERREREAAARRALFVGSLGAFAAAAGLIAALGKPPSGTGAAPPQPDVAVDTPGRVVAEIPITDLVGAANGSETLVRIVAPAPESVRPHVRTRATP